MVALALSLGTTGYLMATGPESHTLEEVHELLANAFLVVVLLHLAGIAVHALKHRDRLPEARAMLAESFESQGKWAEAADQYRLL